eukprot:TRINITY_DN45002_c0_g1_i1.p1 TRINITY_DN45002_c0_g1~~TRINITY_DN45002_c0_g1_i1.p1  ORF type:complete len:157 (+),score=32.63 TRINITY_DN45002_c0_g1_i1:154-624(+)
MCIRDRSTWGLEAFTINESIEELALSSISSSSIEKCFNLIKLNRHLKRLDLSINNFTELEVQKLIETLKLNSTLERLVLSSKKKRDVKVLIDSRVHFVQCLSLIHISEPTRPLYISYAVFCLKKKKTQIKQIQSHTRSQLKEKKQFCLDHNLDSIT